MGKYGLIYIAHNPRDGKNTFKVGKTQRDIAGRMAELTSSTSNIGAYSPLAYFNVADIDAAEQACHSRLAQYRIQENREFFEVEFSLLLQLVQGQVSPYLAQSIVPEITDAPIEELPDSIPISEQIKRKRQQVQDEAEAKKVQGEEAKKSAIKLFELWGNDLLRKLEILKKEFADVSFIRWEEPKIRESNNDLVIKIWLFADTKDQPARLLFKGYESCLSAEYRNEVTILARSSDSGGQLIVWEVDDDHRVAEIEATVHLNKERWETSVLIYTQAIYYYSDKCKWEKDFIGSPTLHNVDEAIDLLTAILAEYAGNPIRKARKILQPADMPMKAGWIGRSPPLSLYRAPKISGERFSCSLFNRGW